VRLIARESDLDAFKNQTVRMNFATLDTLTKKADVIKRFLAAYVETIDFLYSNDPAALKTYADFAEISVEKAKLIRDDFFPKSNLSPTRLSGVENAMADALALKFINAPFTSAQMDDFLKYYAK
jgi:NitT/TauT family transport system substrate-binding protein